MNFRRSSIVTSAVLLVLMTGLAAIAQAAEEGNATSRVPMPVIPMGMGERCVEDTDYMRRNHMDMLKHQRDETMLRGVRTKQYSLKECINCHAVEGQGSVPVTAADPQHFCRSCHDYAAVSIDCFQCHASRPDLGDSSDDHGLSSVFPATHNMSGSQ
jgi:hypothetical protein